MKKKNYIAFSVNLGLKTVEKLRSIAHKNSKGTSKANTITIGDCIRYAITKTFSSVNEDIPDSLRE